MDVVLLALRRLSDSAAILTVSNGQLDIAKLLAIQIQTQLEQLCCWQVQLREL
jgi:hypothetical protein